MIQTTSFFNEMEYGEDRPSLKVLLKTDFSKELRLVFRKGQVMAEHKAPYPITVQVLEGNISFGVAEQQYNLEKGMLIALGKNIPHDLTAREDSIVRLSISLKD